jgi:integral membrane protein
MLKLFRVIAFFEGVSYILLLFIAVPIKYIFDDPTYVKLLGMPHGILFMIYIIFSFIVNIKLKWNIKELFIILIASLVPLGTFYVDRKYLRVNI